MTLEELLTVAGVQEKASRVPTLNSQQLVKVQRHLGIPTTWEKETAMIRLDLYPFAKHVKMHQDEYVIYAVPYLRWINERIACEGGGHDEATA